MTASMTASCRVIIRPTIGHDALIRLTDTIVDKLWPGNAGGVRLIYRRSAMRALAPIVAEVMNRRQTAEFRAVRNGMNITLEAL